MTRRTGLAERDRLVKALTQLDPLRDRIVIVAAQASVVRHRRAGSDAHVTLQTAARVVPRLVHLRERPRRVARHARAARGEWTRLLPWRIRRRHRLRGG